MPAPVDIVGTNTRETNRLRMLETLLRRPARSRGDLGRSLGVSRATVTALLTEFEQAGIVEQQAEGSEERRPKGRPPLQVSLAPDAAFAVGLDFGHRHLRVAVCDLGGGTVAERWTAIDIDSDPVRSLDLAQRLTAEAVAESGVGGERLIGVGVGFAAPVDGSTGRVLTGGIMPGWDGLDPGAELERRLGLPVQVENDANAGAIGEHMFGAGRGVGDLLYLRLSAGIGLGLIIGGRAYRGAAGIAGEIGHVRVVDNGLICRCGNRGCLETVAGPDVIVELLERSRGERLTMTRVMDLVYAGDRGAARAVADAGRAVGRAVAAAVNLLNPRLVVIGGDLAEARDVLLDPIRAAIAEDSLVPAAATVDVVASSLGERAEVLGAASIQLTRAPEALARRLARTA
jgi:predicted NBD/HSP70 family sugar kinase